MNIYCCWRDLLGMGLSAVVQAANEKRAIELLRWKVDENTHSIGSKKIGVSDSDAETVWSEESL